MIPMDREVDELAEVYSPQQLQQKYKVTQELMYLLALQKVQSDMKAAQNQLAMSQQQQPGTIKDQMEGQVFQEKLRQVSGTIAQQEAQRRQQQQRMMASGGIVGFNTGRIVSAPEKPGFFSQFSLPDMDAVRRMQERREAEKQRLRDAGYEVPENITLEEIEEKLSQTAEDINEALADPVTKKRRAEAKARKQAELDAIRAEEPDLAGLAGIEAAKLAAEKPQQTKPLKTTSKTNVATGAGTATGTGGIASQIKDLDDTKSAVGVLDETAPGLRGALIERAKQTAEGIEQAAMGAGERAADIAGRTKKARQFEQMERDQERLYQELQDPDKQQAQMRRNIFAAFGRGGNSFGQLMGNALTAISRTEAGQDQLKQIALDKKQGITTKAIEIDLKAAGQINAAIDNAQSIYAADRRQAETILAGLSSDEFKGIQQSVRNNFDLNNARVTAALDEMRILAQREATQSAREIKSLSAAQTRLAAINDLKAKVYEAAMAYPIGRMAELEAKKTAGTMSKTEAAEYNKLSDDMYLQVTSYFEKEGLNDEAEELARRIDLFTSRTEEQGDVSRALNKYDS